LAGHPWHNEDAHMNSTQRAHIVVPVDLLREIDALVGPRGRTAFLLETAREEVRRRKLLRFLESEDAVWQERDHPQLENGSAAWVRTLRQESEGRIGAAGVQQAPGRKSRRQRSKPHSPRPHSPKQ
jgi:hypothetical protein